MKKYIPSEKEIETILKMYNEDLIGSQTISEKIGLNKQQVLRILKENGVKLSPSGRRFIGGKSASDKRNYHKHKEKRLNYYKIWSENNKDYRKIYMNEYREKNKEKIKETKRNYEKTRKSNDPIYKLIANFRTAIWTTLKENNMNKYGHYFEILKYTPEQLSNHLENQFTDGMTWENYGEWHVDHKLPITSFVFKEVGDEEFLRCWSLDNLQPMWAQENIRKSNRLLYE